MAAYGWKEAGNKIAVALALADETDNIDVENQTYDCLLSSALNAEYPTTRYSEKEVQANYKKLADAVNKLPI